LANCSTRIRRSKAASPPWSNMPAATILARSHCHRKPARPTANPKVKLSRKGRGPSRRQRASRKRRTAARKAVLGVRRPGHPAPPESRAANHRLFPARALRQVLRRVLHRVLGDLGAHPEQCAPKQHLAMPHRRQSGLQIHRQSAANRSQNEPSQQAPTPRCAVPLHRAANRTSAASTTDKRRFPNATGENKRNALTL